MHTVKKGETVFSISNFYGITQEQLREANGIQGNSIFVGQRLVIPGSQGGIVKPDTPLLLTKQSILMDRAVLNAIPIQHYDNGIILVDRVNRMLKQYNGAYKTKLNDGYRTPKETYGSPESMHRLNAAVDFDDNEDGDFSRWILDHLYLCKEIGLWIEHFGWTHEPSGMTWVHLQIYPPKTGKRIFAPNQSPNPNSYFWNGIYAENLDGFV